MANQEHVDILGQGVQKWNAWREKHLEIHPNLSNAKLSFKKLSLADLNMSVLIDAMLENSDISNADLEVAELVRTVYDSMFLNGIDLSSTDLSSTDLSHANLSHANLSHANLSHANLSHANLSHANLSYANLSYANLSRAKLLSTVLGNVDLRTVKGLKTVRHTGPSTIGTDTLERSQGDIPEIFLRGVGLSDTFIEYARALVHKPIEYYTCFISYSSKDEAFAKRLHSELQSEGVRCWFAPEDMDTGDKIKHHIDESIKRYDKLLLILSKHSIASTWVAYEVERALIKEPTGVQNVLYPVRLDKAILTCDREWAQDIKQTRHITNFEGWKTNYDAYQESFKQLLRALKPKETTNNIVGR